MLWHYTYSHMASNAADTDFTVWGLDHVAYGPVELTTLVDWVRGERILADTWIFDARNRSWRTASETPELRIFFKSAPAGPAHSPISVENFDSRLLRRVKILGCLTDEELTRFAEFVEIVNVSPLREIVRRGEREDSMYLILEGEFRVRVSLDDKETILATLCTGEFFGDIALFDHGPRSADVVANTTGVLVKITSEAVRKLSAEAPSVALPFLLAVGRTLAARIRYDNKRYCESVQLSRAMA
jgi:Cyclic nucleotide-binding domain